MAAMRDTFGPQSHHEKSARDLHRDTRPWFQRLSQALQNGTVAGLLLSAGAAGVALMPATVELLFPVGAFYAAWVMTRPIVMPLRPPMRSGLLDVTDPDPETGKPRIAQGLDHIGAEMGTRRQVWQGKDDVAQHTAIPGTTGAGKTEALIALAIVNALVQGTGCVFVDGKADRKLYAKIFTLARCYGREDDVFVWNFLTMDGRDSMTCNPFGPASADMIREMMVGQLNEPGREGNGGVFFSRAVGFLGAIAPVLTWMRDEHGIQLDLEKIRDATELSNVVLLATKKQIKFTDSATGASELLDFPDMPAALVQTLRSYLGQTGGYDLDVSLKEQRSQQPSEQHSYITMQFTEVFSQWLVSLGHIFKVRTGDVDSRVNWLDVRALRPGQAIVLFQNSRIYTKVFYAPVKLAGTIRRNKPTMLDRPDATGLRRHFARIVGVRRAVVDGNATAAAVTDSAPVLDEMLAELRRALTIEASDGGRVSPIEAALTAVLSGDGERVSARLSSGPADADEDDESGEPGAAIPMLDMDEADEAGATEQSRQRGVAPAPGDHAFSDMLRQAAREHDAPVATFTDPGGVAPADRELARALVDIERAGGRNVRQAKLAVRQLLAERDRVLREPVAMRLPPIAPETLVGTIRALVAALDQGSALTPESPQTAVPLMQAEPARLSVTDPG